MGGVRTERSSTIGEGEKKESEVAQSCPTLCFFATPWTAAYQAPLSMGFSMPFPSPRDLPDPGIEPRSPTL